MARKSKTSWYIGFERSILTVALILVGIWLFQQLNWLDIIPELLSFWQWGEALFSLFGTSIDSLLLPSTIALAVGFLIIQLFSTSPPVWARVTVSGVLFLLGLRYIVWRLFVTLNLSDPWNASLSISFFAIDVMAFLVCLGSLVQMCFTKDRSPEADWMSQAVIRGTYCPWVDIWVPTYNEPVEMLRRTIIGCQALDYANKRVYLLDDKRRPQMRSLAKELGCFYLDRPDNRHAKAGNLNNALRQTNGELIVVFDADFIPTRNFLTRTVGFFQDSKVALVQTPQTYYNGDPIKHNLGLGSIVTNDQDLFFRLLQSGRDTINAVICCGSSFIMRRKAVEKIGGIPTETLCEDLLTSLKLQAAKYRVLYLNEALSAGASAENIGGYIDQRIRWGQGTLQTLFCKVNPLVMPGLNLVQRFFYGLGILGWLLTGLQVLFLLVPLGFLLLGLTPLQAQFGELLFFWLPYYLMNLTVFAWLNGGRRSAFWADIYANITCFPLAVMIIATLIHPFGKTFKVTPKGVSSRDVYINWQVASPLLVTLVVYFIALGVHFLGLQWDGKPDSPAFSIFWAIYNTCVLAITIQVAIDVPQQVLSLSFPHQLFCKLILGNQEISGTTVELSQKGTKIKFLEIVLPNELPKIPATGFFDIPSIGLINVPVILHGSALPTQNISAIELKFAALEIQQERQLVEFLFCRPGQWKETTISETKSLWALLRSIFRLYPLAGKRNVNSNASVTTVTSVESSIL